MVNASGRWLAVAVPFLLLAAALPGCKKERAEAGAGATTVITVGEPTPPAATCTLVVGTVEVRRRGTDAWVGLARGESVWEGDWVRTGALSFARIRFSSGVRLDFDESSTIEIRAPKAGGAAQGGASRAAITLQGGTLRGSIDGEALELAPLTGAGPAEIDVVGADGTEFTVGATEAADLSVRLSAGEGASTVQVESGQATVAMGGETSAVAAGGALEVAKGAAIKEVETLGFPPSLQPGVDARFLYKPGLEIPLLWAKVTGARDYRIQVSRDLSFQQLLASAIVADTRFTFRPDGEGMYSWRVVARDAARREGELGFARRVYVEVEKPSDLLLGPESAAVYEYVDAPPVVTFSWASDEGARRYRWVLARGPDLLRQAVKTELLAAQSLEFGAFPEDGEYYWGVYAQGDQLHPEPIFLEPRKLVLKKVKKASFETVKRIDTWGN